MYKLLIVSSDSNIGGAGRVILNYLGAYDKSVFNVALVIPSGSLLCEPAEKLGVRVIEAKGIRDKSLDFGAVKTLADIFKAERPDIVNTHACMSARFAARIARVPVLVATRHTVAEPGRIISRQPGRLVNGMINSLTADKIIAVAEAAKQNLINTGVPAGKIEVVLNGVAEPKTLTAEEKALQRRRFGLKDGQRSVSIIARVEPGKGHEYFIETAGIVSKTLPGVKFIAAGTGSEEERLRRLAAEKGLDGTVEFTGFIKDIHSLLGVTDLVVSCSYGCEATSLALVEALSLSKPCVVTDSGGNSGVIEDGVCGYVTKPKNPFEMAEKITRLLSEKGLYEELSAGARKRYEQHFTAKAMAKSTEEIYLSLLKRVQN